MTEAAQGWTKKLAPYRRPDNKRAAFEVAVTVIPFVLLWLVIWQLFAANRLSTTVAAIFALLPAAGLMVRLFIIQHDCGHGSMFTSRKLNDWMGRILGVFTLTPYEYWRRLHAAHHAGSANLDLRGVGDIDTLTVEEYLQKDKRGRLLYRLYRHPVVLFGFGPAYLFLFRHRLPVGSMNEKAPWISALTTNVCIVAASALLIYLTSWSTFFLVQVPIVVIGASIGVWMFYIQHQFDPTHWSKAPEWTHAKGALHGSSYYDLPKPLMWITGNIGIHHVHHLSSRIPFHKLPQVIKDFPELKEIGRLTLIDSLRCVKLTLWDEESKKLVSFKEVNQRMALSNAA